MKEFKCNWIKDDKIVTTSIYVEKTKEDAIKKATLYIRGNPRKYDRFEFQ